MKVCFLRPNFEKAKWLDPNQRKNQENFYYKFYDLLVGWKTSDCEKAKKDLMQIITRSRRRSCSSVTVKNVENCQKRAKIEKIEEMDCEENQIGVEQRESVEWGSMPSLPLVQIISHLKYSERWELTRGHLFETTMWAMLNVRFSTNQKGKTTVSP